jgi:hypothetical protein
MPPVNAVIYVDGNAGNNGTFVDNDPTHPRKTMPPSSLYGTNSTTLRLSGAGKTAGIRGAVPFGSELTGCNNVIIEQWSGMPAYELRGDTIVQTGVAFTVHSGTTYKCTFIPTIGICAVVIDYDAGAIAGQDPDDSSVTYRAGFDYTKASSLANCIATDKTWWWESNVLYVHDSKVNYTVAGHDISVCDCENSDLISYAGSNNVSVSNLAAALCPTTAGTSGYAVKLTSCTGLLTVTGPSASNKGRCSDLGTHVVGFLNCASATLCYTANILSDGARSGSSSVVWYADSGTYARNACIFENYTTHFRYWLKRNGTAVAPVSSVDCMQVSYSHDEGANTRVPIYYGSNIRVIYCTGLCGTAMGAQEPQPVGAGMASTLTSGTRTNPAAYNAVIYDLTIVNGTVNHHASGGSIYYIRPTFSMPRMSTGYVIFSVSALSLGLNGSLGTYRRITCENMVMVVNTQGATGSVRNSVFTVTIGNAQDGLLFINPSCCNLDTQASVDNLRAWFDYGGRTDDCFEVINGVFEHNNSDINTVFSFTQNDFGVGATRSFKNCVIKGVKDGRFAQDPSYDTFAEWHSLVDTNAVTTTGTLYPFKGTTPTNLGLDTTSILWALQTNYTVIKPYTGTGKNLLPYDNHVGAYQYGVPLFSGAAVGSCGQLLDED